MFLDKMLNHILKIMTANSQMDGRATIRQSSNCLRNRKGFFLM